MDIKLKLEMLENLMRLQQKNKYVILFFTHSGAVKYRRYLTKLNIELEMMAVPRKLSSSCGVCITFIHDDISDMITTDIERIYKQINESNYEELYVTH